MAFRRGAEAAKEASKGAAFDRTKFFGIEDKEKIVVRFLTDANIDPATIDAEHPEGYGAWITVQQHQMVTTKARPDDYPKDSKWPERMGAVCRKDPGIAADDCYICDFLVDGKKLKKPSGRTWAWACIREEVVEDGKLQGYKDKTREVTRKKPDSEETETIVEKDVVVVNMGWKNFFSILSGYAGHYGTVLDRDYVITRDGDDTSTTYSIIGLDPIVIDDKGTRLDMRNPEHLKRYGWGSALEAEEALVAVISERASDEFYARFFDPRVQVKDDQVISTGATATPVAEQADADPARLAELASRVKGYAAPEASAPEAAPAQEAPAATTEAPQPAAAAPSGGMKNFD